MKEKGLKSGLTPTRSVPDCMMRASTGEPEAAASCACALSAGIAEKIMAPRAITIMVKAPSAPKTCRLMAYTSLCYTG